MVLTAFAPVVRTGAHTLILGSMPGVASLQEQRYYAHARNAFWPIINRCLTGCSAAINAGRSVADADKDQTNERDFVDQYQHNLDVLQKHGIALWDVLKHCERSGSLDSKIVESSVECNDFSRFLKRYSTINTILFNGKTAERLFRKHMAGILAKDPDSLPELLCLPSTSPAMAAMNFEEKLQRWCSALKHAGVETSLT